MPKQAQRGGGGIGPTHSQHGTRRRCVVSTTLRLLYPREAEYASGPVWTAQNFAPTGIRSPDRPAHSESLYRLRYKMTK